MAIRVEENTSGREMCDECEHAIIIHEMSEVRHDSTLCSSASYDAGLYEFFQTSAKVTAAWKR